MHGAAAKGQRCGCVDLPRVGCFFFSCPFCLFPCLCFLKVIAGWGGFFLCVCMLCLLVCFFFRCFTTTLQLLDPRFLDFFLGRVDSGQVRVSFFFCRNLFHLMITFVLAIHDGGGGRAFFRDSRSGVWFARICSRSCTRATLPLK